MADNTAIEFGYLKDGINEAAEAVRKQLEKIRSTEGAINIADMFEMQMLMNHLAQLSEMSTSVIASMNSTVQSMARNVKG